MGHVNVCVQYYGLLKSTVGVEEEQISLEQGAHVGDLVDLLSQRHGEQFTTAVLRGDGTLRRLTRIMVDGRNIRDGEGVETTLESAREISITVGIYAIAGGGHDDNFNSEPVG